MVKTIGVIGNGVVGHATARSFMEFAEVRVYDVDITKATHTVNQVMNSDVIFVCVPEGAVEEFLKSFTGHTGIIIIKSTVKVGTTRRLAYRFRLYNLLHSPEFLTARCAVTDAQLPSRNIIGYSTDFRAQAHITAAVEAMYLKRFPGVPCITMKSCESELVKLATNAFFATKVGYWNEVNAFANARALDWSMVMAGVLADGRIAHAHTQVPGPDGKFGYGGACLPKDVRQLIDCIEETPGVSAPILRSVNTRNEADRERAK